MKVTNGFFRPTWAEISLDALRHNIEGVRNIVPAGMKLMAVVKADAYGHGAVEVSRYALQCGIDYLAVALLDEALELRDAGITAPILILGYTPPEGVAVAIEHDITLTVFSDEVLEAIEHRSNVNKTAIIHIKIDSGMSRLGVRYDDKVTEFIDRALHLPGVEVEGLYTHYACADEVDKTYMIEQHRRFNDIVEHYERQRITFPILHAGNSATAIDMPDLSYNLVRLGISMYGLYPSAEINMKKVALQPVMALKSEVVMVKKLPVDSSISYGATYRTVDEEQIATIPIGYADGYARALSGDSEVLLRGQKVQVVGRICMDQCMVNTTGMEDLAIGEEVVLFGKQGQEVISANVLADKLNTINYEITCQISRRVPRVYYSDGQPVKTINYLNQKR